MRTLIALALVLLPSAVAAQEVVEYYALDAIGSVRVVYNPDGTVKGRTDYTPFGVQLDPDVALPVERFAGLVRDSEAGLDHARARSYQVRTGRFSTTDPVYAGLHDPQQWNRYTYARASPLQYTDPLGLQIRVSSVPGCHKYPWECVNVGRGGQGDEFRTEDEPGDEDIPGGGGQNPDPRIPPQQPGPEPTPGPGPGPGPGPDPNPGPRPGPVDRVRDAVCRILPEGRVASLGGSIGALAGPGVSVDVATNYGTGEVTAHLTPNLSGWGGIASAGVNLGFVYNLGPGNHNIVGWSGALSGSIGPVLPHAGGYVSGWSGGATSVGVNVGVSMIGSPVNAALGYTTTPLATGSISLATPSGAFDYAMFLTRNVVCR